MNININNCRIRIWAAFPAIRFIFLTPTKYEQKNYELTNRLLMAVRMFVQIRTSLVFKKDAASLPTGRQESGALST